MSRSETDPGTRGPTPSRTGLGGAGSGITDLMRFYLVAELDWDDGDALRAVFASPEGQATARDVAELATDGVRNMIFEVEDL